MRGPTASVLQTLGCTGVAMVRALRIASEVAVCAFIALPASSPRLPPIIGVPLAIAGFVAMCTQIAFHLHDTNLARQDLSLRD
jgi:hypothetical protein